MGIEYRGSGMEYRGSGMDKVTSACHCGLIY